MNRPLRKLLFGSIIFSLVLIANAAAQQPSANLQEVEVPITDVELGCHPAWRNPLIIGDNQALQKALGEGSTNYCKLDGNLKIDFQKYTLILLTEFADCQAMIYARVTKDTAKKLYVVTLEEKYGGCRGMTAHSFSFLIEKLPPDYSVRFADPKLSK
jgi:hypothetical protein